MLSISPLVGSIVDLDLWSYTAIEFVSSEAWMAMNLTALRDGEAVIPRVEKQAGKLRHFQCSQGTQETVYRASSRSMLCLVLLAAVCRVCMQLIGTKHGGRKVRLEAEISRCVDNAKS